MPTATFLDCLDQTAQEVREELYASSALSLDLADVQGALKAQRPAAIWLLRRFFAGQPGHPLPDPASALRRILSGDGDVADAYAVLVAGPSLPAQGPLHVVIQNGAAGAIRCGGNYLSAWFAAAAALACLVCGEPDRTWAWLELDQMMKGMPTFDALRPLAALRGLPELSEAVWLRRAAWALWPRLALPAVPDLPSPVPVPDSHERAQLLGKLKELGDPELQDWVNTGLRAWDAHVAGLLHEHSTVQAIREAALRNQAQPPDVVPPDGLIEWIRNAHEEGLFAAARLGALLLLQRGLLEDGLWLYVAFDLRADDVGLLVSAVPEALRADLQEAAEVLSEVPEHLREAFAQIIMPLHPNAPEALQTLRAHVIELRVLSRPGRSWLEKLLDWISSPELESAGVQPSYELLAAIEATLSKLGDPAQASPASLTQAIARAPDLDLERDLPGLWAIPTPNQRLVGAMLLRRNASTRLRAEIAPVAATAILDLMARTLFPLREELLEEVIREARAPRTLAWAMKALANTRNLLARGDLASLRENITLYAEAAQIARHAGETTIYVDAVVAVARH